MRFKEWKEVRLGDVVDSVSERFDFNTEKLVLINTSDVLDGKVLNHKYVENKDIKGQFKKSFKRGDILYSEIRPKNRRFAYVDFNPEDYVASTKLMVLRKKGSLINNDYLFQILKSDKVIKQLQNLAETRSGTFPQITYSELSTLKINLPPLEEQKAIAHILSTLDEKIEVNNQINKKLEEIAQTIFKHWFIDFEFPNEDGEPYKSSGGEMVESELGMIPKGWEVAELGEIAMMKNGVNYSREQEGTEVKVVNVRDFDGSVIVNTSNLDSILLPERQIKDYLLYEYDTVVVRSARPGETLLVTNNSQVVYSGFTIRVQTNEDILKLYVFYCIRNAMEILNNSSNGTIFKNLNQKILGALKIVVPNKDVIEVYNSIVIPILNQISEGVEENEKLTQLRDTLLPKLMSGEIRVPLESEDDIS